MSGREAIRMDDAELDAFLRENAKVQVATVGPHGAPHLTTLFYVVLNDGRLAFWTYARSQKVRNLERDSRVTCLVEDGGDYFELRGASLGGEAEIVRDSDQVLQVGTAVAVRMLGVPTPEDLGEAGLAETRRQAAKRVAVVVNPHRVTSWDHRKMT